MVSITKGCGLETAVTRPPGRGGQGAHQHKVKECPKGVMQVGGGVGLPWAWECGSWMDDLLSPGF